MPGFDEYSTAREFRDVVKKIVERVIDGKVPQIRIGKVYSVDPSRRTAMVLFPGQTIRNLVRVRCASDKIPTVLMSRRWNELGYDAPGDLVRVWGDASGWFILDFLTGTPAFGLSLTQNAGIGEGISALTDDIGNIESLSVVSATDSVKGIVELATPAEAGGSSATLVVTPEGLSTVLSDHKNDTTDAHAASAISNVPAGNLSATDVQAALNELDAEKQPLDATLTGLANTGMSMADRIFYSTAPDTFSAATLTAFMRALLSDADADTARVTLNAAARRKSVVTSSATAYTIQASDEDKILQFTSNSDVTVTIPDNASVSIPTNVQLELVYLGTGTCTVVGAAGVTVNNPLSTAVLPRYARASLRKRATDTWSLVNIPATKANLILFTPTGNIAATDVQAALAELDTEKQAISQKGTANGYASLDGGGKVPVTQLPSSIFTYEGVWNASTNTPTLADGTGDAGQVYRVTVAGTRNLGSGSISFEVGDYVIYNTSGVWEKSDTTDAVASVAGKTGVVTLVKGDVGLGNVDNTSDANKPISTATQAAIDAHLNDTTDAHDASAISLAPVSGLSSTEVQDGVARTWLVLQEHVTDTTDAHDASAISYIPTGNFDEITSTDVQDAIRDLDSQKAPRADFDAHLADTTDAHDASAISYIPGEGTGLVATNAQTAIDEVALDKQPKVISGTSATVANGSTKVVTISGYTPTAGDILAVTLTNGNTAVAPSLNINSIGAVTVQQTGPAPAFETSAGGVWVLYNTGTTWILLNTHDPVNAFTANRVTSGCDIFPRDTITGQAQFASQRMSLSYFTCDKIFTASQIRVVTGSTPSSGATLIKLGLYLVNADLSLTLLAATANDTTLLAAADTVYTKAFDAGATVTTIRNQRYAVAFLQDGGTMPTLIGQRNTNGNIFTYAPRLAANVSGLTDLPASQAIPTGIVSDRFWGVVLP